MTQGPQELDFASRFNAWCCDMATLEASLVESEMVDHSETRGNNAGYNTQRPIEFRTSETFGFSRSVTHDSASPPVVVPRKRTNFIEEQQRKVLRGEIIHKLQCAKCKRRNLTADDFPTTRTTLVHVCLQCV
jgi:hypothetical protein